ncbi:MAG: methionyl-tRNA formyltransferase [Acidobacteriota bacterium]
MRVVFMGTPGFAIPTLDILIAARHDVTLVITREDKPQGRSSEPVAPPVKAHALSLSLPVEQPRSLKGREASDAVRREKPDVLVVVAYGMILPANLLRIPRFGGINIHASLLPRYRGAAPINWAIAEGETETGVTTMQMDEGLDTGAILMQARTLIGPRETAPELAERLAVRGAELCLETLERVEAGTLQGRPQDHKQASFAPMLRKEDGRVDWTQRASRVDARVRGLLPWPKCFTFFRGKPLVLHDALPAGSATGQEPGTIVASGDAGLLVACGHHTAILVTEITPFGGKRMLAGRFALGARIKAGERFETSDPREVAAGGKKP